MMLSLYDFLKKDVQKMVVALKDGQPGNLYPLIIQEVERRLIQLVLEETNHNFFKTARMLGISRSTLYRKIKTLDINEDVYKNEVSTQMSRTATLHGSLEHTL